MELKSEIKDFKVAYLHGRPSAHPLHERFAKSLGGKPFFIDFLFRWHDRNKGVLYRCLSWISCALFFPERRKYDVFLIDGIHMPPVLMRVLNLIGRKQKIVGHLGSHTLFFLHAHKFSRPVEWLHIQMLKRYDAVFCEGKMAETIVHELVGNKGPLTYSTFLGPPKERYTGLMGVEPQLHKKNILLIAHGPVEFRKYYKGLDLMIDAFAIALEKDAELRFNIIGDWDEDVRKSSLAKHPEKVKRAVHFLGRTNQIEQFLKDSSLYLHCSRGDAFPTSTMEAMAAGIVPIVSEWTGTKEVVSKISGDLIVPLDKEIIAEKILWYYNLPLDYKRSLSKRCREVVEDYTEEKATEHYKRTFARMKVDLGIDN